MTLQKVNTRNIVLVLIIVLMTFIRLITFKYQFLSNFTAVGAVAIFGGVYFTDKWKAYLVVLLTFFISDVIINHYYTNKWDFFSAYTFWNCVCFLIVAFIGTLIKKINIATSVLILLVPVTIHWLLLDIPGIVEYPKTVAGYAASLTAALPFEKNMLFGDALFGFILFGGFELAKIKFASIRSQKEMAV